MSVLFENHFGKITLELVGWELVGLSSQRSGIVVSGAKTVSSLNDVVDVYIEVEIILEI